MEAEEPTTEAEANEANADSSEEAPRAKSEKQQLKEKIAELEAKLKDARGQLIEQQEQAKDAGEAGYMLLAADFERYRLQARSELDLQEGVGRKAAIARLLPFVEEFERLQANEAAAEANPIHKYYSGIYKQLNQLLEAWEVRSFEATVGERCNPVLHSKAESVDSEQPVGTILQVKSKGWKLGSDTLRQAACVVSAGLPPTEEQLMREVDEVEPAQDAQNEEEGTPESEKE